MKKEELIKLAKQSRIKLTDQEIDKFTAEMGTILDSAKIIEKVDVNNVPIHSPHRITLKELRNDEVKESISQDDALANSPYTKDGYVLVYGKLSGSVDE